ncbi:septum formation initiator family protein [Rhodoferax sp. PAMC 29310]|uniref:septum formation initiator family protein n=1 Tax=Rhodoferax sp. PAMC 29310 TaxID=2822760 RepID=UPI001B32ADA3|nr:septum formation initiator family protein [Rhodoferax sp. PAMC 29310]
MGNRVVPALLITLLVILHAQLWFGRGSVPNVALLVEQLKTQKQQNEQARLANEQLSAEVRDLKEGLDMVEEKARLELDMVKPNEIYVQIAK